MTETARNGGQLIVEALEANGVRRLACVPGESYLPVLDALHDSPIAVTVCRQEGGAAMMADAWGKLTGEPGICFVTRGPGATNASAGLHIAMQDSTPLILFIGQVQRDARERDAFQEIEYRRMFTEVAKWVAEIDDPARIPEFVTRAFSVATSGRPGPVVLTLPEDVLRAVAAPPAAQRWTPVETHPAPEHIAALIAQIEAAERPFVILGGSRWTTEAKVDIEAFAQRFALPVGCSFRRQMLFDHDHPCYAGDVGIGINPDLATRIKSADLVVLFGGRLGEMPSSTYTLMQPPYPQQTLIHIHPDASELGRVYRPDLAIHASPSAVCRALADSVPSVERSRDVVDAAHAAYREWSTPPKAIPGAVQYGQIMAWLNARLPDDAILCNGAGNYASWVHRFYKTTRYGTQLAPTSGSMGYGVPAAVAAKLMHPERTVIAFAGDGCFLMNGQEFATACQYGAEIITIVVDNGMYGTIRMHQERDYPGRVSATRLQNPDFAALARAYGGHGETVTRTEEFEPAFEAAIASGKPAILHVHLDPEAITPTRTLSEIRKSSSASNGKA